MCSVTKQTIKLQRKLGSSPYSSIPPNGSMQTTIATARCSHRMHCSTLRESLHNSIFHPSADTKDKAFWSQQWAEKRRRAIYISRWLKLISWTPVKWNTLKIMCFFKPMGVRWWEELRKYVSRSGDGNCWWAQMPFCKCQWPEGAENQLSSERQCTGLTLTWFVLVCQQGPTKKNAGLESILSTG